jgi:hypothetical protein
MIDADVKSATFILFIVASASPSRTQLVQRHERLVEDAGVELHEPEISLEERRIELIRDAASAEHGFGLDRQTLDRQDVFFGEAELGGRLACGRRGRAETWTTSSSSRTGGPGRVVCRYHDQSPCAP